MPSRQSRCCAGVEPRFFARHLSKNPPPGSSLPKAASSDGFPCGEQMRACWAATLLVLTQPSPAFCATCRGTSVVPQVLALTHRRLHKSPCVRQPFVETSGSTAFSSLCSFPGNCALFLCVSSRVHSNGIENPITVCRRFGRMTVYSSGIGLGKSC